MYHNKCSLPASNVDPAELRFLKIIRWFAEGTCDERHISPLAIRHSSVQCS
jgi:hypothetical protein